jgi:hypothetical protein
LTQLGGREIFRRLEKSMVMGLKCKSVEYFGKFLLPRYSGRAVTRVPTARPQTVKLRTVAEERPASNPTDYTLFANRSSNFPRHLMAVSDLKNM